MSQPGDVGAAIRYASKALRLEHHPLDAPVLDEYIKKAQQDADFRRNCATLEVVWSAIRNAFTIDFQQQTFEPSNDSIVVLNNLLRLSQFIIAGIVPESGGAVDISDLTRLFSNVLKQIFLIDNFGTFVPRGQKLMRDLLQSKLICLRALANISTVSNKRQMAELWAFVVEPDGPFVKISREWRKEYLHPLLHIYIRCQDLLPMWRPFELRNNDTSETMPNDMTEMNLFSRMLIDASELPEDDQSPIFGYRILMRLFEQATFLDLWRAATLLLNKSNEAEGTVVSDCRLVLLKFADGMLHEGSLQHLRGLDLEYFIPIFVDIVENRVSPLFANPASFSSSEIDNISTSAGLLLGIFEASLHAGYGLLSLEEYTRLTEILVDFLGLLHKHIPIQGLSRSSVSTVDVLPSSISFMFKGMKRDVIIILTLLLQQYQQVQDVIREKGGIQLILSQCNIDDDNPYLKERATLCIRALLENNEINQSLVRNMTAITDIR